MGFIDEDYLLETKEAKDIYSEVQDLPIVDIHSHVDVAEIAENEGWEDIWQVEAETDHYVWELMRKRGIPERKITGDASNKEKWTALAEVFPDFAGNPVYDWMHMDLKRRFGIEKEVREETAEEIWEETSSKLSEKDMKPINVLRDMNVEILCSTDSPVSELKFHEEVKEEPNNVDVLPTWRPDDAMNVERGDWKNFVVELEKITGKDTSNLEGFMGALEYTHDYFDEHGCVASDHALERAVTRQVDEGRVRKIYERAYRGDDLDGGEVEDFKAYMLHQFGKMNEEKGWVTQLHIGAVRDYRTKIYRRLGQDSGGDISSQNIALAKNLKEFVNAFDEKIEIVLYCLDSSHYSTIASIARCYPNISIGAPWWFNDSPYGMEHQLNYVGTVDLLSNFAGMVSDSRKLVSFGSRFEMFRRSLSNVLGKMVSKGRVPMDTAKELVTHISYERPKKLLGI